MSPPVRSFVKYVSPEAVFPRVAGLFVDYQVDRIVILEQMNILARLGLLLQCRFDLLPVASAAWITRRCE